MGPDPCHRRVIARFDDDAGPEGGPHRPPAEAVVAAGRPDVEELARILLYGSFATRQGLARRLGSGGEPGVWDLLATTLRRDDSWRLRARSLEALGLVAGSADRTLAEAVLSVVLGGGDLRLGGGAGSARGSIDGPPGTGLGEE